METSSFGKNLIAVALRIQATFKLLDGVVADTSGIRKGKQMSKENIVQKALERLNHPGKPAAIKVKTPFEQVFREVILGKKS